MDDDRSTLYFINYIKNELNKFYETKKIVSLFTNKENTNKFSSGIINRISNEFILLSHIDPNGMYDGFVTMRINNIYSIEYDGQYENKILALYKVRGQKHKQVDSTSENINIDILKFAKNNELIVTLELLESELDDCQGLVIDFDTDYTIVKVNKVDTLGNDDGIKVVDINTITHIYCDTDEEQSLKILYEL